MVAPAIVAPAIIATLVGVVGAICVLVYQHRQEQQQRTCNPIRRSDWNECSVCLECFEPVDMESESILQCGHKLHSTCLFQLIHNGNRLCRVCRKRI